MHLAMTISLTCWLAALAAYAFTLGQYHAAAAVALCSLLLGLRVARILNSSNP